MQLCVNSFNILNGEMQSVATGIYLAPSVMDHSCSPNAVVTFDGPRLSVRLVQDIPQFDWSLVRISYIDQMTPGPERKRELAQRYYFNCDCPRCSGAADSVDCYRYAARCLSCSRPAVAEHWGHPPRCSCGYQCDQERSRAFWSATEYSEQQLQLMQEVNCSYTFRSIFIIYLEKYLFCMIYMDFLCFINELSINFFVFVTN